MIRISITDWVYINQQNFDGGNLSCMWCIFLFIGNVFLCKDIHHQLPSSKVKQNEILLYPHCKKTSICVSCLRCPPQRSNRQHFFQSKWLPVVLLCLSLLLYDSNKRKKKEKKKMLHFVQLLCLALKAKIRKVFLSVVTTGHSIMHKGKFWLYRNFLLNQSTIHYLSLKCIIKHPWTGFLLQWGVIRCPE